MKLWRKSTGHLRDVGESYVEHGGFAIKQGFKIVGIGLVSIVHGVVPGLFPFYTPAELEKMGELARRHRLKREKNEVS